VVRCLATVGRRAATVTLRLRIEGRTGRVSRASVVGAFARSPVRGCVVAAAQRLRFPRFRQPSQWVTYPVIIRMRSGPRTRGQTDGARRRARAGGARRRARDDGADSSAPR
jgi:hypothetical protein